ncbi:MAG: hypothetical protein ABMA13_15575, partial [Chthoniobacteraceae bacterium]
MRKSVWIFLLAVLVPSAVLGWLALSSAEQQKIVLERRTAELYQRETENLAAAVRALIDEQRRAFAEAVRAMLKDAPTETLAQDFAAKLPAAWPRKAVGFSLGADGRLLSPAPQAANDRADWRELLREHGEFLAGSKLASVYNVAVDELTQPEILRRQKAVSLEAKVPAIVADAGGKPVRDEAGAELAKAGGKLDQLGARDKMEVAQKAMKPPLAAPAPAPLK